jgi:hypothetical protein
MVENLAYFWLHASSNTAVQRDAPFGRTMYWALGLALQILADGDLFDSLNHSGFLKAIKSAKPGAARSDAGSDASRLRRACGSSPSGVKRSASG